MSVRVNRRGVRHANGHRERNSAHPKISVRFDDQQFDRIEAYARQCDCTFGEAVRLLTDYAFDKLDQEDQEGAMP